MRVTFDRGTLLVNGPLADDQREVLSQIPGVLWDPRVNAHRAPARLAYALVAALGRKGVPIEDAPRPRLTPPTGFRAVPLRPYQEAALLAWRRAGRRGVVVLPTGAGKTRVALAAIAATRTPALCLVPTRALLAQWVTAIAAFHDGPIGRFGDHERVLHPVTVATFASAYRHMATLGDRFGLLIVDEVHHFGHGVHDEALEMSIAPLRMGLTASPSEAGVAPLTRLVGPIVFQLSVGDLEGQYLAPLRRIAWGLRLDPDERREYLALREVYRKALREFQGRHLGSHWKDFVAHASRTDEGRVGLSAWRRASRLLAFPRCKQQALALLLERHRGQRTLVFVAHNETAYAVAREHLIMPLTCDIGAAERQEVLRRFQDGTLRALVSAQVLNEGLDVPDAEVGIVVAGRMGEREHVQRVGRLLRPGQGKRALIYELVVMESNEVGQARRRSERLALGSRPAA